MEKKTLPYPFKDCIISNNLKQKMGKNYRNYLVIYKAPFNNSFDLAKGYLKSAEIIVNSIYNEGANPSHDELVLPLLNLYVNTLEFLLKYMIEELENHRKKGCKLIKKPSENYDKALNTHKLLELSKLAKTMLPTEKCIHYFSFFDEVISFADNISVCQIDSESTRYLSNKKGETLGLHTSQSYLNFDYLHKNVVSIFKNIESYLHVNDYPGYLHFCECHEFSEDRLNELILAKEIMEKKQVTFKKYIFNEKKWNMYFRKKYGEKIERKSTTFYIYTFGNLIEANANETKDKEYKKEFLNDIKNLNETEIAALAMGLSFNIPAECVKNLNDFQCLTKRKNEENIINKALFYNTAFKNIQKHINLIKKWLI